MAFSSSSWIALFFLFWQLASFNYHGQVNAQPVPVPVPVPAKVPVPAPVAPVPVKVPAPAPKPTPKPVIVIPPFNIPPIPPFTLPPPPKKPCGLLGFSIFCPNTYCGIIGRSLGLCQDKKKKM